MSDISKYPLIIILSFYFLVIVSQTVVDKHSLQQNGTNNSKPFQEIEENLINQTSILDYDFFSYDIIDHRTLLIKFDITPASLFQQSQILYDAYLYVSKIPAINYRINLGPFSGLYEKEIAGTLTDHFTFCLVLLPNQHQNKFNINVNRKKNQTIFHQYLRSSYRKQQQHIVHYCTKMGPDENRHRQKQGSKGDYVLLLLQIMMIGIFLVIIQLAHLSKNRKYKEWRLRQIHRIYDEFSFRKEYSDSSDEAFELLRFPTINDEESREEEPEQIEGKEEEQEDSLTLSHRRLPTPITKRQRSQSPSPSISPANNNHTNDFSVEHILESKPWLQISQ
jgi:hypothetical protein